MSTQNRFLVGRLYRRRAGLATCCAAAAFFAALMGCADLSGAPLDDAPSDAGALEQDSISRLDQAVIGGTVSAARARPWQAQISVNGTHQCGGSLLLPEWVLTAGHCVQGIAAGNFTVTMGELDRTVTDGFEQVRTVAEVVLHPGYSGAGPIANDVALLRLSSPVSLNERVATIRPAVSGDGANQDAILSGWGWTNAWGTSSNQLMETVLPIATNASCDAAPNLAYDLASSELCAGFLNGTSGGCHGDSGGPLVVTRGGGTPEQVGVVSWGQGGVCGTYTVFARVTSQVRWIRQRVIDPAVHVILFPS